VSIFSNCLQSFKIKRYTMAINEVSSVEL